MPQALPLTDLISQGSTRRRKHRVLSAQFGDGYSQEAPDGINAAYDEWSITYIPLTEAERATLWTALDAVGCWDYFTWQPPGDNTVKKWKVIKDTIAETPESGNLYTIAFELRQHF